MTDKQLSIGRMAKLNGLSVQTLRYYEKLHLIAPAKIDCATGYRYYDIEQIGTLDIIRYLKAVGLSLQEIYDFLHTESVDSTDAIRRLEHKIEEIDEQMADLAFKKTATERVIRCLEDSDAMPETGIVVLENCPKRYALICKSDTDYYENTVHYERGLLNLKAKMRTYHLPYFYSLNPGAITRMDRLTPERLYCDELFVYVDKPYCGDNVPITEIPGGISACIYCNDVLEEKSYVHRLLEYINAQGLIITGDCIQDCINDIIAIKTNRKHLLMRIRIPVRFPKKQR